MEHVIRDCVLIDNTRSMCLTVELEQKEIIELLENKAGSQALKCIIKDYYDKAMTPVVL